MLKFQINFKKYNSTNQILDLLYRHYQFQQTLRLLKTYIIINFKVHEIN